MDSGSGPAQKLPTAAAGPAGFDAGGEDAAQGARGDDVMSFAADGSSADAPAPEASAAAAVAAPEPPPARTALAVPELWMPVGAAEDPFDDRPVVVNCPASAAAPELLGGESSFSIDTGSCDYLTVTQPARRAVAAGETLKVRLWHFELSAPAPAEAHAAVLVDGIYVLDERVPIPHAGGLISRQLLVTRAIPAGAPVYFHLHNHGTNYWALVEVSAGP